MSILDYAFLIAIAIAFLSALVWWGKEILDSIEKNQTWSSTIQIAPKSNCLIPVRKAWTKRWYCRSGYSLSASEPIFVTQAYEATYYVAVCVNSRDQEGFLTATNKCEYPSGLTPCRYSTWWARWTWPETFEYLYLLNTGEKTSVVDIDSTCLSHNAIVYMRKVTLEGSKNADDSEAVKTELSGKPFVEENLQPQGN